MPEDHPAYVAELRRLVDNYAGRLSGLPEPTIRRRPAPGKWSLAEIIGHLVDSASNNHQRFVRGPQQDSLVFPGYAQDEWVTAQGYQDTDWKALLELWRGYNLHLARVMERMPAADRKKSYMKHNFDQVAFRPLPAGQPATLEWFMEDYVEHFKHHLRQIDALLAS
jgi:hypothetical protein